MITADESPRDLADRIIRKTLPHPPHLRSFLQRVVPDLAGGFDCDRARIVEREVLGKTWRRREADMPFEIPYRTGDEEWWALVFVLIEHQSDTDPNLPLRMLYYAIAYWERQWTEWERLPRPRPPLRLHPILPIVLYTGASPWGSNRTLADLLGEPTAFHAFAPTWQPAIWNLSDNSPQALLDSGAAGLQMLTVMRSIGADTDKFQELVVEAHERMKRDAEKDREARQELIHAMFSYAFWKRPAEERESIKAIALRGYTNPVDRQRMETMVQTIAEAYIEEGVAKGELKANRAALRRQLTLRFGAVPETVLEKIEAVSDPARLQAALDQVIQMKYLDELSL